MAGNERELKLKLTVTAPDTSGTSRAMQDIANHANRASAAMQDLNRHQQRMTAPGMGGSALNGGGLAIQRLAMPGGSAVSNPGWSPPAMRQQTPGSSMNWADRNVMAAGSLVHRGATGAAGLIGGAYSGAMSALGPVGVGVGVAAATVATLANSIEAVAKMHDPMATTHQKLLEVTRVVPLFGESLAGLANSVVGAAERLTDFSGSLARDRYRDNFQAIMATDATNAAGQDRIAAIRRSGRGPRFDAAARQQNPGVAYSIDSVANTIGGVGGFALAGGFGALDGRVTDGMESIQNARRGSAASEMAVEAAKRDLIRYKGAAFAAEQARAAADAHEQATGAVAGIGVTPQGGTGGGGMFGGLRGAARNASLGPVGMLAGGIWGSMGGREGMSTLAQQLPHQGAHRDALLHQEQAITRDLKARNDLYAAEERHGAAMADLAKKRHEISKAETALAKTRVDLLQEELGRTRGGSREFLAMNSVDQRGFADAFDRFRTGGRDAVTSGELQALSSSGLTGKFLGDQFEKEGANNEMLKRLLAQLGVRDEQTIQNAIRNAKVELVGKVELDEDQATKVLASVIDKLNGNLEGLVKRIVIAENNKNWIGKKAGNATGSGP